jgi:hypothetical protein
MNLHPIGVHNMGIVERTPHKFTYRRRWTYTTNADIFHT